MDSEIFCNILAANAVRNGEVFNRIEKVFSPKSPFGRRARRGEESLLLTSSDR